MGIIKHECKQGVLSIDITIPDNKSPLSQKPTDNITSTDSGVIVAATFESDETGIIYTKTYAIADLTTLHPILGVCPEMATDLVHEMPVITCMPEHIIAHFSAIGFNKRTIEFDMVLAKKIAISSDGPDTAIAALSNLQAENRVLRRRMTQIEAVIETMVGIIMEDSIRHPDRYDLLKQCVPWIADINSISFAWDHLEICMLERDDLFDKLLESGLEFKKEDSSAYFEIISKMIREIDIEETPHLSARVYELCKQSDDVNKIQHNGQSVLQMIDSEIIRYEQSPALHKKNIEFMYEFRKRIVALGAK